MNQLYWIYLPDVNPHAVFLLNYRSVDSNSVRYYADPESRPRKMTPDQLGGRTGKDLLKTPWRKGTETGVDVDRKPAWWYQQSRPALREARRAVRADLGE